MLNIPNNPEKQVDSLRPFTYFCMSLGMIPASYKTSLTYEEQLLWLCDYLENSVIPTVNNNANAVSELQSLYIELRNYVDNYFTNLDVQEEINNKLDTMASDGTLTNLIAKYVDPKINMQNQKISQIENQVNSLASGSPLVANSIEEMTETNRIYVNTSNGHWYWYNGSNWNDGGIYQATEDSETVNQLKTKVNNHENLIIDGIVTLNGIKRSHDTTLGADNNKIYIMNVPLSKGLINKITLKRNSTTNFINVYLVKKINDMMTILLKEQLIFSSNEFEKTFDVSFEINEENVYIGLRGAVTYEKLSDNENDVYNFFEISSDKNVGDTTTFTTDPQINKQFGISFDIIQIPKSIKEIEKINERLNKIDNIQLNKNYFLINKVLCIGDSLTEGDTGVPKGSSGTNVISENYPFYLKKISNANLINNVGKCGATVMTVVYDILYDMNKMKWDNDYDTIIIMLGTNGGLTDTIDKEQTEDENPNCRGYQTLIEECKKRAPNAQIFLITPPYAENLNQETLQTSGEVVKKLGIKYNIPVFDIYHDLPLKGSLFHPNDLTHFNKYGYIQVANYFIDKINEYYTNIFNN